VLFLHALSVEFPAYDHDVDAVVRAIGHIHGIVGVVKTSAFEHVVDFLLELRVGHADILDSIG
jgi:hypothetical protein